MKNLVANNESEKKEEAVKKDEETKEDKILKLLTDIDVCKICAVRIISGNQAVAQIYGKYDVDESEVKRESHCFLCVGILEEFNLCAVAKSIAEQMQDSKYESPTFQLGVAIPQCLILRQSSMVTYLVEKGDGGINRNIRFPSFKNIAKFFLIKLIEKFTQKKLDNHSDLFVKLDFIFPQSAIEVSKLDCLLEPERKKKSTDVQIKVPTHSKAAVYCPYYRAETITKVIQGLQDSDVKKYTIYPPQPLAEACEFAVSMHHTSLFFGGRYNKYSRTLLLREETGEGGDALELIGEKLIEFTQGSGIKFPSAGGKEDVDVRILGKGQPFAAEIIDPKVGVITEEQLAKLQVDINSTDKLVVHDLQKVNRAGFELMKKGDEGKVITYTAKLWCPEKISDESIQKLNEMKDIELQQNKPIRVLHRLRYPIAKKLKKVQEVELKRTDEDDHYMLNVKAQAGIYIKEFVHGDFGRTEPSLRTILGAPIDILELDFISIDLNWPPELDDADKNGGESKVEDY